MVRHVEGRRLTAWIYENNLDTLVAAWVAREARIEDGMGRAGGFDEHTFLVGACVDEGLGDGFALLASLAALSCARRVDDDLDREIGVRLGHPSQGDEPIARFSRELGRREKLAQRDDDAAVVAHRREAPIAEISERS